MRSGPTTGATADWAADGPVMDLSVQRRNVVEIAGFNTEDEGAPLLTGVVQAQRLILGIPDGDRVTIESNFDALTSSAMFGALPHDRW